MLRITLFVCIIFTLCWTGNTFCQANFDTGFTLEFNFFNPGARALGMGGAFVALADDSTAALANPAGLTTLIRPELSVEYSATDFRNRIPFNGGFQTYTFSTTHDPDQNPIYHVTNFRQHFEPKDFPQTSSALSFASFVYPVRPNRFVVSAYYNEQAKFKPRLSPDPSGFGNCEEGDSTCTEHRTETFGRRFLPTEATTDLRIRNAGFSVAVHPWRKVSLGSGVTVSRLSLAVEQLHSAFNPGLQDQGLQNEYRLSGEDNGVAFTAGTLLSPWQKVSFGFVFSRRPKFDASFSNNTPSLVAAFNGLANPIQTQAVTIKIPDSLSAGVSVKPSDVVRINADAVFVRYSQLMDRYFNVRYNQGAVDFLNTFQISNGDVYRADFQKGTLEIEDGIEYRVGGEYVFRIGGDERPLAVRGGYWREPFHGIIQTVADASLVMDIFGRHLLNSTEQAPFWSRTLKDEFNGNHLTFGFGFTWSRFSIDSAYDYSKNSRRFIVSSVFYLGNNL